MSKPWEKSEGVAQNAPQKDKANPFSENVSPAVQTSNQSPNTIVLSQDDAYIHEVVKAQPKSLDEIDVKVLDKEEPGLHRLSLPNEIKPYESKYTFRWLFRNRRAISEATQLKGWVLVNRMYFPDLPGHLFTANGVIERGDGILAFTRRDHTERLRKKNAELAKQMVNSRLDAHKGNPNFYTPAAGETAEDGRVIGI